MGKYLAAVVALVLLIALAVWAVAYAPCGLYKFSAGKDIPGRCLGVEDR